MTDDGFRRQEDWERVLGDFREAVTTGREPEDVQAERHARERLAVQRATQRTTDCGFWDGDVYIFTPPMKVTFHDGATLIVHSVDTAGMAPDDTMTRYDLIHALLNAVHIEPVPADTIAEQEAKEDQ